MPANQPESNKPQIDRTFQIYLWACEVGEVKTVKMILEKNSEFVSKQGKEGDTGLIKIITNSQHLDSKPVLEIIEMHLRVSSEKDLPVLSKASNLSMSIYGPNSSITLILNQRISALKPKRTTI